MKLILTTIFGLFIALFLMQCLPDAPHVNALDPIHGIERLQISGTVKQLDELTPIAGATVAMQPGNFLTLTDQDGRYSLDVEAPDGMYTVTSSHEGYEDLTQETQLSRENAVVLDFAVNGLPLFDFHQVASTRISTFRGIGGTFLELRANVNDPDGINDIETVWCNWPEIAYTDTLIWVPQENEFQLQLNRQQINVNTLHSLIGKPLNFQAIDRQGAIAQTEPLPLIRIIETPPIGSAPIGLTTQPFDFVWAIPDTIQDVPFPFTYSIEIYLDVPFFTPPEDVIMNIPPSTSRLRYENSALRSGESYYWVLYYVDEFGNRSRSVEYGMEIQ